MVGNRATTVRPIAWWEKRRIVFNVLLLGVGALSFAIIEGIGSRLVEPGEDVVEPLAIIFGGGAFIIGANVCYTLGWVTELMWSEGDTSRTEHLRHRNYRRGLILSLVIAAAPGVIVPVLWLLFGFH